MPTLHNEIHIEARPEAIWDAARDLGALHTRLVPGFVVNTQLDGNARIVTFGNGMVVREPIISVDDQRRRLAWTAIGGKNTQHNTGLEVLDEGSGARVVWTTDLLPDEMAAPVAAMQESGLAVMKKTFEQRT